MWKSNGAVHLLLLALLLAAKIRPSGQDALRRDDTSNSKKGSFLWRVSSSPPSFFFGTIHVPFVRVWDAVPQNAKRALARSRHLFLELDLTRHSTVRALSACQLLPEGRHLSQVIPQDVYLRLRLYLDSVRRQLPSWLSPDQRSRGITADYLFRAATANWERKRPVWVMMMLDSLTRSDVASRGVPVLDLHLAEIAKRTGKKLSAIEEASEQCGPINNLGLERVVFALNHTLSFHEGELATRGGALAGLRPRGRRGRDEPLTTDDLIRHYRNGDADSMRINQNTFQIPTLHSGGGGGGGDSELSDRDRQMVRSIDQYFRSHLVVQRNRRMAARVVDLLVNRPQDGGYFFAFGAGHFVGEDSVLEFVRSAGFTVERVAPGEKIDFGPTATPTIVGGGRRRNRVQGTFDDLPDDEKTKALLQFLQYKQQQQQDDGSNSTQKRFEDLVGTVRRVDNEEEEEDETEDEKAVEESLKVWYGLNSQRIAESSSAARVLLPGYWTLAVLAVLSAELCLA